MKAVDCRVLNDREINILNKILSNNTLMEFKIEEILKHHGIIFNGFVVGYFILYVLYGNMFLDHDILTRIVLSISVSLMMIFVGISAFTTGKKLFPNDENKKNKKINSFLLGHTFIVLVIFSIIQLFNIDIIIIQNPILLFPTILVIFVADFLQKENFIKHI